MSESGRSGPRHRATDGAACVRPGGRHGGRRGIPQWRGGLLLRRHERGRSSGPGCRSGPQDGLRRRPGSEYRGNGSVLSGPVLWGRRASRGDDVGRDADPPGPGQGGRPLSGRSLRWADAHRSGAQGRGVQLPLRGPGMPGAHAAARIGPAAPLARRGARRAASRERCLDRRCRRVRQRRVAGLSRPLPDRPADHRRPGGRVDRRRPCLPRGHRRARGKARHRRGPRARRHRHGPRAGRGDQPAYAAIGRIRFEGMHFRTDIARKGTR